MVDGTCVVCGGISNRAVGNQRFCPLHGPENVVRQEVLPSRATRDMRAEALRDAVISFDGNAAVALIFARAAQYEEWLWRPSDREDRDV